MTSSTVTSTDAGEQIASGAAAEQDADQIGAQIRTVADDPTAAIDALRSQIDAMDTAIARLVAERAELSRRIQTVRVNAGGTRIELGRERAILDHYRSSLGASGAAVAEAVLRACRGAR